uniref:Cysteine synthase n=1 Tax=Steinernema glaseri TaxID=37863 RepID=A0A1I7Y7Q0_9BILA
MVYLNKVTEGLPAKVAVKLEYFNPGCSVKDRIGRSMIEAAEKAGILTPGESVIVEPTSGNTGIALAIVGAVKGYKTILVMPDTMSIERRTLLKAYGADLVLTDKAGGFKEVMERAKQLTALVPNAVMLDQFHNEANPNAHYHTTGPEIWTQTDGKVDICVFGVGTAGTLTGVSKYIHEQKPEVKFYAVEPFESSVLNGFEAGPHDIHGIGAGVVPPILDRSLVEETLRVKSDDAMDMARRLCVEEGLMVGISSGANVVAAIELAKRPENAGKLIVTSAASFGERYLSTKLYLPVRDSAEAMSKSTIEDDYELLKEKYGIMKSVDEVKSITL